tara:strand:+ start:301 stop:444 length:144 start_codon:yes stop_codon:yes gene_type:complete
MDDIDQKKIGKNISVTLDVRLVASEWVVLNPFRHNFPKIPHKLGGEL